MTAAIAKARLKDVHRHLSKKSRWAYKSVGLLTDLLMEVNERDAVVVHKEMEINAGLRFLQQMNPIDGDQNESYQSAGNETT